MKKLITELIELMLKNFNHTLSCSLYIPIEKKN